MNRAELLPLNVLPAPGAEVVGTKAATLGRLLEAGFPVPAGLCLTTTAFRAALAPRAEAVRAALPDADLRDPSEAQQISRNLESLLTGLALTDGARQALERELPALGAGPLAIRSSATQEDLAGVSFAGQYLTRLGVRGAAEVEAAILDCWRSLYRPQVTAARAAPAGAAGETPTTAPAMAVLIQPLLDAECSGVCFSVDPLGQDPETLLIVAAWGLGAGVVDGSVPADRARVRRRDLGIESLIPTLKDVCLRPDSSGGVRREAVPAHQQRPACLPDEWLQAIARVSLALEQALGGPQDVEWAIAGGQVWILQSRPITTLPPDIVAAVRFPVAWANDQERRLAWHPRDGMGRAPGEPLLPAEMDYLRASHEGGQAAVVLGGGDRTYWTKFVNGRSYWALAPSPVAPADQRIRQAAQSDLYERLERQEISRWEYFGPEVVRATERLEAFDARTAGGPALADHLEDTLAVAQRHWMLHTLGPRTFQRRLFAAFQTMTGVDREAAEPVLFRLLEGEDTVQTRLIDDLFALAQLAHATPAAAQLLAEGALETYARLKVMAEATVFLEAFDAFLVKYGSRPGPGLRGDGLLATLPWRENPDWVLGMVARYLPRPGEPLGEAPAVAREQARQRREAAVETLCAGHAPELANDFRRAVAFARREAIGLDDHNHYIDQLADGQFLQALLHAGRWLAARGDLARADEAAWLAIPQTLAALRRPEAQPMHDTIAVKQRQMAEWRTLLAPAVLGLPRAALPPRSLETAENSAAQPEPRATLENQLVGQGVSVGKRSGRARLVAPGATLPDVHLGDVLILAEAGTLWTPIFPMLAAVVLDWGHVLQHAAITLREFGVPAVFGAGDATRRIPEDAWVTVDGEAGTVEWGEA